jgi:hypothetical protein
MQMTTASESTEQNAKKEEKKKKKATLADHWLAHSLTHSLTRSLTWMLGDMPYPCGNVTGLNLMVLQFGPYQGLSHTQLPSTRSPLREHAGGGGAGAGTGAGPLGVPLTWSANVCMPVDVMM